jgi:hypothetical protein
MGIATFIGMIVIGSVFSAGIMMFFKKKIVWGVLLLLLTILCYIGFVQIVTTYFT